MVKRTHKYIALAVLLQSSQVDGVRMDAFVEPAFKVLGLDADKALGRFPHTKKLPNSTTAYTKHGPITGFRRKDYGYGGDPNDLVEYKKQDKFKTPVDTWSGVRFAPQPDRFAPPQHLPDDFVHPPTAKKQSPQCLSPVSLPDVDSGAKGSEDCLFLDIVAPTNATNLPVLIYIYGGGFDNGDSWNSGLQNAAGLASRRNMVVVNINYRLGALGYWASDFLKDKHGTAGNWGMLDQRMAFQWVRENIDAFGGDPNKITLCGESAGAMSINWHMASPDSFPFFDQAITMGASNHNTMMPAQPWEDAKRFYNDAASTSFKCTSTKPEEQYKCLLALDAEEFVGMHVQWYHYLQTDRDPREYVPQYTSPLFPAMPFAPVIDGSAVGLKADPYDIMMEGKGAKVPLLVGSNRDGGSVFVPALFPAVVPGLSLPIDGPVMREAIYWMMQNKTVVDEMADAWPADEFKKAKKEAKYKDKTPILGPKLDKNTPWSVDTARMSRMTRDLMFTCSSRRQFESWTEKTGQPVWPWMWGQEKFGYEFKVHHLNAAHGMGLPFLFGTYFLSPNFLEIFPGMTKKEAWNMHQVWSCYWANFVHTGNPNNATNSKCGRVLLPDWPAFDVNDHQTNVYMSIRDDPILQNVPGQTSARYPQDEFPGQERCDIFNNNEIIWHNIWPYQFEYLKNDTWAPSTQASLDIYDTGKKHSKKSFKKNKNKSKKHKVRAMSSSPDITCQSKADSEAEQEFIVHRAESAPAFCQDLHRHVIAVTVFQYENPDQPVVSDRYSYSSYSSIQSEHETHVRRSNELTKKLGTVAFWRRN